MVELKSYRLSLFVVALFSAGMSSVVLGEVLFLRYSLGVGFTMIGSLLGLSALAFLVFSPFVRLVAERVGHGRYIVWSGLGMCVAAVFAVLVSNPGLYLAPRLVLSLFAPAVLPVLIAFVRELLRSNPDKDYMLFSLVVAGVGGSVVGFLGAGLFAREIFANAYLFGAGCFFIAGLIGTGVTNSVVSRYRQKLVLNPFVRLERGFARDSRSLALLVFVSSFLLVVRDFVLPLWLWDQGFSFLLIACSFALFGIGTLLFLLPVRRLLSRNPPQQLLLFSLLVMGVCLLLLPVPFLPLVMVLLFVLGLGDASVSPGVGDAAREMVSKPDAKKLVAALGAVSSLSFVLSPILIGILLEAGVLSWVVLLLSGLLVIALFFYLRKEWNPRHFWPRLTWKRRKKFVW